MSQSWSRVMVSERRVDVVGSGVEFLGAHAAKAAAAAARLERLMNSRRSIVVIG